MNLQSSFLRTSLSVSAVFLTSCYFAPRTAAQSGAQSAAANASQAQTPAVPARIRQAIDEGQLVRLKGNVHPLARPEFDQGAVPDSTPMSRMLLLLQRSPEQEAALQQLLAEQQAKDSPNFHKWLTPQQFGAQFGPADTDIQTVTDWLTRQGFQGIKVAAGKTVVEFSGTARQVRNAFQTEIHHYLVNGKLRQANSADPQIPAALTPVVAGIVTLHNFPRKSMKHNAGIFVAKRESSTKPLFTTSSGCGPSKNQPCYVVGPADFAKIYSLPPTATLDGTGVTIALVADSNIDPQDVADFRALFGLSANFTSSNIILNGPDPGLNGDEGEADLDVQTAGMVAPGATIKLVVSEDTLTVLGIDLSALYIVDNNVGDVVSESFGICEPALGTTGNQFYNALWEQAAAQGATVMVSAGDNGSAGCDDFTSEAVATAGLAVSGIASTPFNVAVGGTDFDDAGTQTSGGFWSATNAAGTRESAQGYIHEIPWNDSCAAAATSANLNTVCASASNIVAASGGPSAFYTKTHAPWQNGITPADGHRDLPDISLFASDGQLSDSFYLFCQADAISPGSPPSCASSGQFSYFGAGGTSASSPAFAGVMALINQQQSGRQGNANPVLYTIAQAEAFSSCNSTTMPLTGSATCVFYDVTKGNNSVPCAGNSTTTCSSHTTSVNGVLVTANGSTTPAFTTGTAYDLATGLGTVNVTNLAAAWKTTVGAFKASSTSTKVNNGTTTVTITHGQSVNLSATVTSATGTPTGDVSFLAPNPPATANGGIGFATLSGGTASLATTFLPGGSYNVKAHYAGDGSFAPSDDPTGVPVVVNKENSRLQYGIVTSTSTNATTVAYGSPYILRFEILNSTANACTPLSATPVITGCAFDATGTVTITDNGSPLTCSPLFAGCTSPFPVNSQGSGEDQPIQLTGGTHMLSATYSGDISYNAVSTPVNDTVVVTLASTSAALTAGTNPVPANQAVTLSVAISSQSNSAQGPTGSVTFKDGSNTIGTATVTPAGATSSAGASGTASFSAMFTTTGSHSLTAVYAGDTNYATSTSAPVPVTVGQTTTTSVSPSATTISSGGSITFTATVVGIGTGASPTGTVQFMNGSAMLGAAQMCTAVPGATSPTCKATLATTLAFLAPPPGPNRIPKFRMPLIPLVAAVLMILLLLNLKRVPPRHRRAYATVGFLFLAGLVAGFATGCGGGYGGGGGGTHYDSITAVYSGDSNYAGSISPAVQVTVQ
ncbi:MAG TPA: Ig-like domain repeat protein [Candidatus Acidoferrum sp.]|nr:Ig-like domain repeat protein [Candidatus Acidoferrum sp.]